MKYLLILLFPAIVFANQEECNIDDNGNCVVETQTIEQERVKEKTPEQYKKSSIKRKMKDGTVQEFNGDDFKIVPRTQTRSKIKTRTIVVRPTHKSRRHNISLHLGYSPNDHMTRDGNEISHEQKLHFGASYMYDLIEFEESAMSLGVMVLTNETAMGSIGLSF